MSGTGKRKGHLVADRRYRNAKKPAPAPKPRMSRKRKPAKPKRGPIGALLSMIGGVLRGILRIVWALVWRLTAVVTLIIGIAVAYYASTLPSFDQLLDGRVNGSVTLLDRDGQVFATRGDQHGGFVTIQSVSPHLHDAIVATEDRRFYWHPGVDPIGIANAIRSNLSNPGAGRGGSTLTQQTAKLLCNGREYDPQTWESEAAYEADCRSATIWRKAQEAAYAIAMEVMYTKEEILTIYLNRAYFGGSSYGVEAASNRYFGISASELSPAQAANLAGVLQAPSRLALTSNVERSQGRASVVVGLMEAQGYLSSDQAAEARANPANLSEGSEAAAQVAGAFADWVMRTGPEFFTHDTTEDVIIRTTLDPRIQTAAEQALLSTFDDSLRDGSEVQGAVIVMSADGAVRAMVGGRDVRAVGLFNRATSAVRQPGSSFKPFIFAAALDQGYSGNDVIIDEPICWTTPGSGEWCPENYDREFVGPVDLTTALEGSRNIPAIVLSETVGRDNVRATAQGFGIQSDLASGPALALGVSEATLIEMTGAYAGILNGGSAVTPYGLIDLRMRGDDAPLMEQDGGIRERVIREEAARELTWMMNQVVERGTGSRARIEGYELAAKTGTTNGARDAWFIGFSSDYVVGVWMGFDDNEPMQGVTGGGLPAEIWRRTMEGVLAGSQPTPLPMMPPEGFGAQLAAESFEITDEELDRMLEEQFGAPAQTNGQTNSEVDALLDSIFGNN